MRAIIAAREQAKKDLDTLKETVRLRAEERAQEKKRVQPQFVIERRDRDDGSIDYEIWDYDPKSYRRLCTVYEEPVAEKAYGDSERGQAWTDANLIVKALNAQKA